MCKGSKFILTTFLCCQIGIATVQIWKDSPQLQETHSVKQEVFEKIEPHILVDFGQILNSTAQKRQISCEDVYNWTGGLAREKTPIYAGVLNGKSCMAVPVYTKQAIEQNAEGQVNVEVFVDGLGIVKSAKAVSGNPILHKSVVEAAYKTRVQSIWLRGEPVNVRGLLIYKFVLSK